jgi:hypothetical protein
MVFERGPYVIAAAFCERALQERDGVLSLIRIIDKWTTAVTGPAPIVPDRMPPVPVNPTPGTLDVYARLGCCGIAIL